MFSQMVATDCVRTSPPSRQSRATHHPDTGASEAALASACFVVQCFLGNSVGAVRQNDQPDLLLYRSFSEMRERPTKAASCCLRSSQFDISSASGRNLLKCAHLCQCAAPTRSSVRRRLAFGTALPKHSKISAIMLARIMSGYRSQIMGNAVALAVTAAIFRSACSRIFKRRASARTRISIRQFICRKTWGCLK